MLAVQIVLELIQTATKKLLKWVFHGHCQICIMCLRIACEGKRLLDRKTVFIIQRQSQFCKLFDQCLKILYSIKIIKHRAGYHRIPVENW